MRLIGAIFNAARLKSQLHKKREDLTQAFPLYFLLKTFA